MSPWSWPWTLFPRLHLCWILSIAYHYVLTADIALFLLSVLILAKIIYFLNVFCYQNAKMSVVTQQPFQKKEFNATQEPDNVSKSTSRGFSSNDEWRNWVQFDKDLKYDYFMEVDCDNLQQFVLHEKFSIKQDSVLNIFYNPEGDLPKKRIVFEESKEENNSGSNERLDVTLSWNESKGSLLATCKSDAAVICRSHVNGGVEEKMKKDKAIELFCFPKLFTQLSNELCVPEFDPSDTALIFDSNSEKTTVSIRSRTAGCLYYTFTWKHYPAYRLNYCWYSQLLIIL